MPGHQPDWSCWCQDDWCVTGDCKTGAGEVQDHWHSSSTASVCASASSAVRLVYILTTRHTRGHSHTQYHHQHHSIQQISSHTPYHHTLLSPPCNVIIQHQYNQSDTIPHDINIHGFWSIIHYQISFLS